MAKFDKPTLPNQSSSLSSDNIRPNHHQHSCSDGDVLAAARADNKENICCINNHKDKENLAVPVPVLGNSNSKAKPLSCCTNGSVTSSGMQIQKNKSLSTGRLLLKPSSLQLCMQMNEPDRAFMPKIWDSSCFPAESEQHSSSLNIWDYSDSEAAPASSWSTLPNRALLCRPLPVDVGKCTCLILKEASPDGLDGATLYSLYTNEGHGRQDRKLAIAYRRRNGGRSEFMVAQKLKGLLSCSDESFVGNVTANLMGSKYHIWNQNQKGQANASGKQGGNPLLGVVTFVSTISTWSGSYRKMKAYIPKHQSMQLKNNTQVQHINGLPNDWEERMNKVHKLHSRTPHYNTVTKQHELDFRDRGKAGPKIQSSVKNFQLTLEENGKQTILQLGRVGKSKFVMDFRYPLNGYQAFCVCLASIDSKLCCAV
ncbi:Tubby-like protein 8 [Linum grandiflorum]